MIELRARDSLGQANFGWLNAAHHFSFADYHDPKRMNWGALRVWNDDEIQPGTGFPPHPHANMEIITYVREGAITHEDNLGNKGRTEAGDVQVMSAGTGIRHSEYNLEPETTRLFQLWLMPDRTGGPPSWGAKPFPKGERAGRFVTLASGFAGDEGALPIRSPSRIVGAAIKAGESLTYPMGPGRYVYLVTAHGDVEVNGLRVSLRSGLAAKDEDSLTVTAVSDAEVVLVDTV